MFYVTYTKAQISNFDFHIKYQNINLFKNLFFTCYRFSVLSTNTSVHLVSGKKVFKAVFITYVCKLTIWVMWLEPFEKRVEPLTNILRIKFSFLSFSRLKTLKVLNDPMNPLKMTHRREFQSMTLGTTQEVKKWQLFFGACHYLHR